MSEITAGRENGRKRDKGYVEGHEFTAKVEARLAQVDRVLEEYADYLPLTVRQIFYRLVSTADYPKDQKAYDRLAETLVTARRARRISFGAIRDDGVVRTENSCYSGIADFHDETSRRVRSYRVDRQVGQAIRIELWCEAAGMLTQLARVASVYSVSVYSAGGFGSLTANYGIARRVLSRDVPTVLLHVGDFDPSGVSIFEATVEDASAFVRADRVIATQELRAVRVALTAEQVEAYELPTRPAKASDTRSRAWTGGTCELEALPPDTLAELVRREIEFNINPDAYERQLQREREDRAELLGLPRGDA